MNRIEGQRQHSPSAAVAFAVSLAALLLWGLAGTMKDAGALWVAVGAVGLAGAVAGWRSLSLRQGSGALALAGLVIGGLAFAAVAVFVMAFILGAGWAE